MQRMPGVGLALLAAACGPTGPGVPGTGSNSGDSSGSSGSTDSTDVTSDSDASASGTTTVTSGGPTSATSDGTGTMPVDCELLDQEGCIRAVSVDGNPCSWETFRSFSREGDVCTRGTPVSMCVELSGWTTGGGCGIPEGCEVSGEVPFYRQLPTGEVLIGSWCGGSPPVTFSACETGLPDVTPGECACVCSLAPGGQGEVCEEAKALLIDSASATPGDPPAWNPGESIVVEAVLLNQGPAFYDYPGIAVEADHPGVTSQAPTSHLFGIEAGNSVPISVVFDAAANVPAGTYVTFTITVDALNQACMDLDQVEVMATVTAP